MSIRTEIKLIIEQAISKYEEKYDEIYSNFYTGHPDIGTGLLAMNEEEYIKLQEECSKSKKEIAERAVGKIMKLLKPYKGDKE